MNKVLMNFLTYGLLTISALNITHNNCQASQLTSEASLYDVYLGAYNSKGNARKAQRALHQKLGSKLSRFLQIKKLHNRIHDEMQTYVDASESNRKPIIDEVHNDIENLFEIMYDLVEHYN